MGLFDKKKKKKNATRGKFEKIVVDGKILPVMNFYLFTNNADKKKYIELSALDAIEELHFSEITMDVFLTTKKLTLNVSFVDAFPKGKFKIYKFEVLSLNEYYI